MRRFAWKKSYKFDHFWRNVIRDSFGGPDLKLEFNSTALYNTVQHSTVQYVQYGSLQCPNAQVPKPRHRNLDTETPTPKPKPRHRNLNIETSVPKPIHYAIFCCVQYSTVKNRTLPVQMSMHNSAVQYRELYCSTAQYSTGLVWYSTISTVRHSTIQYVARQYRQYSILQFPNPQVSNLHSLIILLNF